MLFSSLSLSSFGLSEEEKNIIETYSLQLGKNINFSLSGSDFNVARPNLGEYQPITNNHSLWTKYHKISQDMDIDPILSLEEMLDSQMGDCFEQSLFLALALKQNPLFDKYVFLLFSLTQPVSHNGDVFGTDFEIIRDNQKFKTKLNHTFIALVPRTSNDLKYFEENIKGDYLHNNNAIVIDPFINRYFDKDVLGPNSNPFTYWAPTVSLANSIFSFQNLDLTYVKTQKDYKKKKISLKNEIFRGILAISDQDGQGLLKKSLQSNDFELLLRQSAANRHCIDLIKIITKNSLFLAVDINAKGKTSGLSAFDVAVKNRNYKAVEILQHYIR